MKLSLIYARSENHVIGQGGRLPWRLPDDFKHFKASTMGHPIIMGRKTFEDHNSVLPGRTNIVLTGDPDWTFPGIVVKHSLAGALQPYQDTDEEVFVIGGASLLADAFGQADHVYETLVHAQVTGDVVLPAFDFTGWSANVLLQHAADDRHAHAFTATRYDRLRGCSS